MKKFNLISSNQWEHIGVSRNSYKVSFSSEKPEIKFEYNSTGQEDVPSLRKVKGESTLYLVDRDSSRASDWNIDELNIWADKKGQDLIFLCHFLADAKKMFLDGNPEDFTLSHRITLTFSLVAFLYSRPDVGNRLDNNTYPDLVEAFFEQSKDHKAGAARYRAELCMDDDFHAWFAEKGQNREVMLIEAAEILKDADTSGSLRDRINSWLLRWYNLTAAARFSWPEAPTFRKLLLWGPETFAGLLLIAILGDHLWPTLSQCKPFTCIQQGVLLSLYAFPLVCLIIILRRPKETDSTQNKPRTRFDIGMRIMLPRLAAAITAGYFVLMNNESWQGAYDETLHLSNVLSWPLQGGAWFMVARTVVPLCAVFLYIHYQIGRIPGIQISLNRAAKTFFRGLSYAILIALPLSDLFGKIMLGDKWAESLGTAGIVGRIIPEIILYLAPLALFIGFFLQLLWEDKSLTDDI